MLNFLKNLINDAPDHMITYADFIHTALYHPELGYYMKEKPKIGREGDFITTSNISDLYGRLIAKWFAKVSEKFAFPLVFCEIGGGGGRFAKAFLEEWHATILKPIDYIIVETSPYHRKLQADLLNGDHQVTQVDSLEKIKKIEGVIYSNELFDALPVHVIEQENGELYEVMVGIKDEQLVERKVSLTNPEILSFLEDNHWTLRDGQRLEVPIAMGKLIHSISEKLLKGFVLTADYGYTYKEWAEPQRAKGSLRGYYQHNMIHDVLKNPGEMDITTHIHFDHLQKEGEHAGLQQISKLRQDEFLLKLGILEELANHYDPNPFSEVSKRNRAIRSLIMPGGISSYFHVVIQQKGLEARVEEIFS